MPLVDLLNKAFREGGYTGELRLLDIQVETAKNPYCNNDGTDILITTRHLSPEELALCTENNINPVPFRIGTDSVVIAVNPLNGFLADASLDEIEQIFQAERWVEINSEWPNEQIQRFVPDQSTGTFNIFADVVFQGEPGPLLSASNTHFSHDSVDLVEEIALNPYGIGFFSHTFYQQNAQALRLLNLEGISPTDSEAIDTARYPLTQPLIVYADSEKLRAKPEVAAIINFYLFNINKVVDLMGYFPISSLSFDRTEARFLDTLGYQ